MGKKRFISNSGVKQITTTKAHKLLGQECEGFLCNVVKIETAEPSLQDIPVVREFLDVFPKEFPGKPPLREAEFALI